MSYLIRNNEVIAETSEKYKSGEEVRVAWQKTADGHLVNAVYAKVSNAKKWVPTMNRPKYHDIATLHDDCGLYKDFYVL